MERISFCVSRQTCRLSSRSLRACSPKPAVECSRRSKRSSMVIAARHSQFSHKALLHRKFRFHAESLIAAVLDLQPLALRSRLEVQSIVRVGVNRKPVLSIDRLANGGKARKQVLRPGSPDLRHGLPFHTHNVVAPLLGPDQTVEEPLPVEDLSWPHLKHPAVHAIHGLFAAEQGFVVP